MKEYLRKVAITSLATVSFATAAWAASVECPIDDFPMYFTGQTRVEMGRMLYLYKCGNGHTTWVVQ